MAERTMVTQVTQIGIESTEGTGVAANRVLPSLQIVPSIMTENQFYGTTGKKVDTLMAYGREWSEAPVSGGATYDELIYLLACILKYAAPAQVGATTAYTWTHSPSATAEDTIKTLTIEHGSSVRAHESAGNRLTELSLDIGKSETKVGGKFIGKAIEDGITLTSSPTAIAQVPIVPKDWSIYADDTWAGLGTTQLLRAFNASLKIGPRFAPFYPINRDNGATFQGMSEVKTGVTLALDVEADAAGSAFIDAMRASELQFIRLEAESATEAGTATPYAALVDLSLAVDEVGELKSLDGEIYGYTVNFRGVVDATSGKWIESVVTNKRSTL